MVLYAIYKLNSVLKLTLNFFINIFSYRKNRNNYNIKTPFANIFVINCDHIESFYHKIIVQMSHVPQQFHPNAEY